MAIKPKTTVTLKAQAHCPSHSRSDVAIRDLNFAIDEPTERGGTNAGPTPTDTAISALLGCTNVIGHKCAAKLGVDIGELTINVECDFDRRGVTLSEEIDVPFTALRMTVVASGPATQAQVDTVAVEVAKFCPISKLFKAAGTTIEESWQAA